MAELSDADKKVWFGAGYKDQQAQRDLKSGETDQVRAAQARDSMLANSVMTAWGLALIAFLIGLANYYSRGTPYNSKLVIGCLIVVTASVVTALAITRYRRSPARL